MTPCGAWITFPLPYVLAAANNMRTQVQRELGDFAFRKHLSGVWLIYNNNNKTRSSNLVDMHEIDRRVFMRVPPIAKRKFPSHLLLTAVKIRAVGVSSYTTLASVFLISFSVSTSLAVYKLRFFVVFVAYCSSLLCALYIWNLA